MVVTLCGAVAEIPVRLEVKLLQVISWIPSRHAGQHTLAAPAMAPSFDCTQIGKKIEGTTDLFDRLADPFGWRRIEACLDVAPVLLQQQAQVREQALPAGRRASAQLVWHRNRPADPSGKQLLTEEPTDPGRLRRSESKPVQRGHHHEGGIIAEPPVCKGFEASDVAPDRGAAIIEGLTDR